MTHIIRTTDRTNFLKCREMWDFGSKIRQNYEPKIENTNLSFGTSIHKGLEVKYDPKTWGHSEVANTLAMQAFNEAWVGYKRPDMAVEQEAEWYALQVLGTGMLEGYFKEFADEKWTPLYTELEFEVPIYVGSGSIALPPNFVWHDPEGYLIYKSEKVLYQGRIDLIVRDEFGFIWIVDHKTTGKWYDTGFLDMDEQCGSYAWAVQHVLGIEIRGVIYNELYKSLPEPPKVLKKGDLSKDKSQNTTAELYRLALDNNGLSVVGYEDFLQYLEDNPRQFYRRTQVHRSQKELQLLGDRIALEAIDMLNDPSIYPAPDRFKCGNCDFQPACYAHMEGSDHEYILNATFRKRN